MYAHIDVYIPVFSINVLIITSQSKFPALIVPVQFCSHGSANKTQHRLESKYNVHLRIQNPLDLLTGKLSHNQVIRLLK